MEYSSGVSTRDVQFNEEDDIEYRDGRLVKASGTMSLTIDNKRKVEGDDRFSDIDRARGSFSMELKGIRIAQHSRRRRAVKEHLDSGSSVEENLMATYNKS